MKKLLLSLMALSVLGLTPVLAADLPAAPDAAVVAPLPDAISTPAVAAPQAPSLPADLFAPAPVERGLMGPCTIRVNCTCSCGTTFVACNGQHSCVGGGGVSCDGSAFLTCTWACNSMCGSGTPPNNS